MEFENISSTKKAVSDFSRLLGLQKVKTSNTVDRVQAIVNNLTKACKLSRRVLKKLRQVLEDPEDFSDYVATVGRFTAISEKIISKIGGNPDVKEDSKTY